MNFDSAHMTSLASLIKQWAHDLGFAQTGITDTDLSHYEPKVLAWLVQGMNGTMHFMAKHGSKRTRPAELQPGTLRVISVRMDYWPDKAHHAESTLNDPHIAYVSRYATGRDYHKIMRKRLQKLADKICEHVGPFQYRAFVDSAPVLEKPLAEKAGLGWIGKHTNLINSQAGSWFFLGELYTNLPLPIDPPATNHCGSCSACISACPTNAIVAPYVLDARLCISYLTIEHSGEIPVNLRPAMGNRIYGCDDCQLVCPWTRFTPPTQASDFQPRHSLDYATLLELFAGDSDAFLKLTESSAIRRIGYERWIRNIAVALGNAPHDENISTALKSKLGTVSELVDNHIYWALGRQSTKG